MAQYNGSPLGIKFILALYSAFGYTSAKKVVWFVALFYALITHKNRQFLNNYYQAVELPQNFTSYFRHVYAFSLNIFDRFIAKESTQEQPIKIERINLKAFEKLQETGGVLILSHHGNWAQSFKIFQSYEITLNIISDEAIDENIQRLESDKEANKRINIINLKEGMQAMLDIARALQNGEIIIIMVDRVKEKNKTVEVDFLGRQTLLHSGGFEIAQMREAPLLGCDIVRSGDQKIKIEFSEIIDFNHKPKPENIQASAQAYAHFLEKAVKAYPYQWFNFFDFWKRPEV